MVWFWLNAPLAVAFIGAWCGIPLAKVLRNPEWGPEQAGGCRVQPAEPEPVGADVCSESRVDSLALAGMPR